MNLKHLAALAAVACVVLPVGSAQAWWRVGIGIGVPLYRPYYPVYVAPAPVYVVQPAPVAHERAALRGGDDGAEGGDAILSRHGIPQTG